ncbi:GDSL esterase/lipase At5g37690 [Phalaenopsis equestris]|uniref:GDSL esterase/lipase At5g37690 n=1 Tax=Phalaenopsis equestris TaxID=78828 RepID=UPI0009E5B43C|nr:GDSL esterase/lipase At5g37690 [Phalaenopsis equestris]
MAFPFAFSAIAIALAIIAPTAISAQTKLVTFVFGDSLTDVGNNNFLPLSLAKSNYPWYGIDYLPRVPTGRFTNGRTIGDIISAKLGIEPPPPYLSLSLDDDEILHGVNYASGGAGILNETGIYFVEKLSFDDQITCFQKTAEAIRKKIGNVASKKLLNEAVYFIGLGSNDYVNNFLQPFLVDAHIYTYDQFLSLLISTLDGQLKRLYSLGARRVVFDGLGPMGCIPSQRIHAPDGGCLELLNKWALHFNTRVKSLLTYHNYQLPGALFSFSDNYNIVLDLIQNPQKYGFKISTTSCCNVDTTVGGLCLPNSKLCDNRHEYVFWDAYHPTDAANQVIADLLFASPSFNQSSALSFLQH